jgi:hypothetical protein
MQPVPTHGVKIENYHEAIGIALTFKPGTNVINGGRTRSHRARDKALQEKNPPHSRSMRSRQPKREWNEEG